MLVRNGFTDLLVLGADPCIVFVAMGMQLGQRAETLLVLAVVNEPSDDVLAFEE